VSGAGRRGRGGLAGRWAAVGLLAVCGAVLGAPLGGGAAEAGRVAGPGAGKIDAEADRLDYDRESGWVEGRGHAVVRMGEETLYADFIRVNTRTWDADAFGNVKLERPDGVWTGPRLHYNLKTREGDAPDLVGRSEPFRMTAERSEKGTDRTFTFHRARITTCKYEHPHSHYHIRARRADLVPGKLLTGRHAVWYFGRVPVMYLPYWRKNLEEDSGFSIYPGYSSRMGAFLLTSYKYPIGTVFRGRTHLDYRTRRGIGVGQDFAWRDPEYRWHGDWKTYYLDDSRPVEDDDPPGADIDSERYRVRVKHEAVVGARGVLQLKADYLSDTDILEDFFEDDYRRENEPDNFLSYLYRGDRYTASLLVRKRLNDFYTNVERVPDVSLDVLRQPLGKSRFYYEGETAAAYLRKVWEEDADEEDYSAFRLDSDHTVYRPMKRFGFLNVIPRAGYRGTYYSDTAGRPVTRTVVTSSPGTNWVVDAGGRTNAVVSAVSQTNTVTRREGGGSAFRSRVELGLELSYKAFKMLEGTARPMRHVVEPYLNYTLVPEPSVRPEELYAFDAVDELDEMHETRIGVRNKLQRKDDGGSRDLIDLDVYTIWRIERDEDQDAIEEFFFDGELRPGGTLWVDFDGVYNLPETTVQEFNTQVGVGSTNACKAYLEYRYTEDVSSLLSGNLTFYPNRNWTLNTFARYEM